MDAGGGTQSKCQNNNLVHLPGLFFCCSNRKNKTKQNTFRMCAEDVCAYLSDRRRGEAWSVDQIPILCWNRLERDPG